jgi:tRNA(fMet)-specific endonuclease VapC
VGILIDSTAFIHAERNQLTCAQLFAELQVRHGDVELAISVMSAGELFHGCWRVDTAARRARREEFVEAILAVVPVVSVTMPVARVFGEIDAGLRSGGQRLPTSDLLIACTALVRGDEIITGNVRHFDRVPGLVVHEFN